MAKAKPYYADGALSALYYDVVTAADARLRGDEEVYVGLARPGSAILELGAGTGRLTCDLAARGFTVTGVDIAAAMLSQARARVSGLDPDVALRVTLRQGDLTSLDLKQTFDLVICPYHTLAHIPAGAAWKNGCLTAARHLAAGGLFAVHLPKLEVMRNLAPIDPTAMVMDRPLEDGRRLRLYVRERAFREGLNRLEQVLDYAVVDAAGVELQRSSERLVYYMQDPQPFAMAAGFTLDRPPIEMGGDGDIWVFRKGQAASLAGVTTVTGQSGFKGR